MAIDIATIGIEMDTSSVKAGVADMDKAAITSKKMADEIDSATKRINAAGKEQGKTQQQIAREVERAQNKIQKEYEQSAMKMAKDAERLANKQIQESERAMRAAQNQSRSVMQNFGWQMQDAIVQLQMGTNAAVVFSQQGSQLASAFNPMLGLFVAIAGVVGGSLLSGFIDVGESIEDVKERVMGLSQELSNLNDEQRKIVEASLAIEIDRQKKSIDDQTKAIEKQRLEVEKLQKSQGQLKLISSSGFGGIAGAPLSGEFSTVDNTAKIKEENEKLIASQSKLVELELELERIRDPENKKEFIEAREEEARLSGLIGEALYREEAAIKGLSKEQADRYVAASLEIDANKESIEIARKKQTEIEKLDARHKAYSERLLASMQREADLFGVTSREAQVTYDIKNGLIDVEGGLNGQIAQSLILNAQRIDQMNAQKAATDEYVDSLKKWVDEQNNLAESNAFDAQELIDGVDSLGGAWSRTGSIIVDTFGSIADALDDYQSRQNAIAQQEKKNAEYKAKYINNPEQMKAYYIADKKLNDERVKSQLSGFRSMAGAAASMFSEQSKGRKVMHSLEMGFAAVEMALTIQKSFLAAKEAVLTQGKGDPYSAFARMAAMGAIVAGLGYAVGGGGGGGGTSAQSVQDAQGTGSVLGSNDKSASIENSFDNFSDIAMDQLVELRGIRENLAKFQGGIAQLSLGVSTTSLADQKYFAFQGQSLGQTMSEGLYIGGSQKKHTEMRAALSPLQSQISSIFSFMTDTLSSGVESLGLEFERSISDYWVNIGKVSFKDMSAQEIEQELSAIFSQQADLITEFVVPAMKEYQQMGEGLFETLTRVSKEQAIFNDYMDAMGLSMQGVSSLMAIDMAQSIADMMGGFDNFTDKASSYVDKFFTDAEKFDMLQQSLSGTFDALGVAMPTTIEGFRDLVEGVDRTTTEGQRLFAALLEINPSFAEFAEQLEDANSGVIQERINLENQLKQLTQTENEKRAEHLASLDESNRALQEQIYALQDQAAATRESEAAARSAAAEMQTIANQRYSLETKLLQLEGNTGALRERELEKLDESNRALQLQIWAMEDQKVAADEAAKAAAEQAKMEQDAAEQAMRAQEQALDDARRAAEEQRKLAQGVHDSISDALRSLMGQSDALAGLTQEQARSTLQSALSVAKAGGSLVGFAGLDDALSAIQQLDASSFSSGEDYRAAMGANIGLLSQLEKYTRVDGSHATGLDYVPFDGYIAKLHRGERVQTASEASGQNELLSEIRTLRSELKSGTIATTTNLVNVRRLLEKWDGDGLPEERVA